MSLSIREVLDLAEHLATVWFELGLFEESDIDDENIRKALDECSDNERKYYEILAKADLGATSVASQIFLIGWDLED